MMKQTICAALFIILATLGAHAQVRLDKKCSGPVYGARELTRRARIIEGPELSIIRERVEPNARGRVVLEAVLCRTGQVTDIRIIEGLGSAINEFVVAAASIVRFDPAELRWHSVSQRMRFEIVFGGNEPGIKVNTLADDAVGRLIENVNTIGHRRLTAKQILNWIQTRPGEPYNFEQIERDLDAILRTGHFDKSQTSVIIEDGIRGGIDVTFMMVELPLIGEIGFEGLKLDRSVVVEALQKAHINLQPGVPYRVEALREAVHVIKQLLDSNGHVNSQVETKIEMVTAMTVKLTFVIRPDQ